MLEMVMKLTTVAVLLSATISGHAHPPRPLAVGALEALLNYRQRYVNDRTTKLEACSAYAALGLSHSGGAVLPKSVTASLSRSVGPCRHTTRRTSAPTMWIDSTSVTDTVAMVFLTVARGEFMHREEVILRPFPAKLGWGVVHLRIWGAVQSR